MNHSDLIFYQVLLASVVALALLLVFDYHIHKKQQGALLVSQSKNEASIVAVSKPELLPRLEPLAFTKILRRSIADYRANSLLIVPPLALFVQTEVTLALSSTYLTQQTLSGFRSPLQFLGMNISLVVSFVVLLGQVSMTGKVVSDGKTRLGDWPFGVKKYFLTVFGVSFVFSLLFGVPQLVIPQLYYSLKPVGSTTATLVYYLLREPLYRLVQSAFYVCLAGVGLDDRDFGASLRMGRRVIRDRLLAFAGLLVISVMVSFCIDALANLIAPILANGPPPLKIWNYVLGLVGIVFSPLWFLIAFRIYRGFDEHSAIHTQIQPSSEELSEATARRLEKSKSLRIVEVVKG